MPIFGSSLEETFANLESSTRQEFGIFSSSLSAAPPVRFMLSLLAGIHTRPRCRDPNSLQSRDGTRVSVVT